MIQPETAIDDKIHWYKDAIIYELHIKAFSDSNGDGIGDFEGLLTKLDYLQELGITAIWLLPFYPSPLKDDGYDISDYYTINSSYGTIEQFQRLLEEAHKRQLKVITELVINHTSDQHPWFQRARTAPKGSIERDFYVWSDDPELYKEVRIIFQDFETSNWSWDPVAQQYYWHRFFHHQPDLNYDSPVVQHEVLNILDYWCQMGVDGFRLDAVPYLFEREGTNGENLPETHAFLKKLRAHIDEKFPGTVFLAEANMWPEDSASYFGNGDECHMNYHFPVMPRMFMALQREDRYPITDIFEQTPSIPETCQWAMFLRNHDELTLEMVTDEERDYMYKVYAKDPKARINLGIRHRLAPLMDNDRRKIELMNSLLFSMPGTPVIYYGDEIGMGDNFYLGDRNGVRTPMQWSPDRNAGFSAANPHSLYLPVIIDPEYNYEAVNVELQRRNTSSLFWYMKRIITLRKNYKAFGRGDMKFLHVDNPKILAFTRTYQNETLLVVVNLSKYSQSSEIPLHSFAGYVPIEVFSKNPFPTIKEDAPYFFTLGPHSFLWFELQPAFEPSNEGEKLYEYSLSSIGDVESKSFLAELEKNILPHYLYKTNWFVGKERSIHDISIIENNRITIATNEINLLLLEVNYENGLPENYILPITVAKDPLMKTIKENYSESVIALLKSGNERALLCDAFYIPEFQQWIFRNLQSNSTIKLPGSLLQFTAEEAVKSYTAGTELKSRIHPGHQKNTSIAFDNRFFLKLYRKVDSDINPDVELSYYLAKRTAFTYTPLYLGKLEWQIAKRSFVLGQIQEMVENHGDGRTYMTERLNNYIERILAKNHYNNNLPECFSSLTEPLSYDQLPQELQTLLGGPASEQSQLLGKRVAMMHIALSSGKDKDFVPEEFSLHYQRSLFSSMQSMVRETFQNISKVPPGTRNENFHQLKEIVNKKDILLNILKEIYSKKIEASKIRIHGNLHLQQILFTGKDIAIHDFGGNPHRNYSERRLKRSAFRDVASMIRSFYYVAHKTFLNSNQFDKDEMNALLPFATIWSHYMSGFFLKAYLEKSKGNSFIPENRSELEILIRTQLLEGAINDLNFELNHRPEYIFIPLKIIDAIVNPVETKKIPVA
ncbi:maltose alpha-D-glucosyltransferase [Flavisolibacter ginsengisoli]|jgi:maltose alpha-D-glucosyltransferase/alpha-amylase|uniref:Maltokinase n=1 Tax=Flavisolibacter ginsengisoli DSM 18119 TaxID=1121884 RepID=A0A1M4SAZ6_9BACT|nr:maltose alpha-D-glucosyltransferase [Flavisolibacter ginsengisoli]SHE29369.1 maltose alpha-D-glucosyltransferase/ alpha-amylase [Flavisolibacter ginsengisoli DSM 18119]